MYYVCSIRTKKETRSEKRHGDDVLNLREAGSVPAYKLAAAAAAATSQIWRFASHRDRAAGREGDEHEHWAEGRKEETAPAQLRRNICRKYKYVAVFLTYL